MADYTRPNPEIDFTCTGMSLRPIDKLAPGKFQYLQNTRITAQGRIDSRPGVTPLNANAAYGQTNVHSIRRLNDSTPGASPTSIRIVGAGLDLYTDTSTVPIDINYSGNPLSMAPYRPDQSVDPQMYIADSTKMVKVTTSGIVKPWGIPQPTLPPTAQFQAPTSAAGRQFTSFPFTGGSIVASGTAGAGSTVSQVPTRAIAKQAAYPLGGFNVGGIGMGSLALYTDNVSSIFPTYQSPSMGGIFPGMQLILSNGVSTTTPVLVEVLYLGAPNSTVSSIQYDFGVIGPCVICAASLPAQASGNSSRFANPDLAIQTNGIGPGSWVKIGTEFCLITAVINGPNGTACFRTSTTGTHAASETLVFIPTVIVSGWSSGPPWTQAYMHALQSVVTAGTGYIGYTSSTPSSLVGAGGYGYKEHDYLSISLYVDNPANLVQVSVAIDIDPNGHNDFQHNAVYGILASNVLFDPLNQGQGQWQQYLFRFSDLLRIGTDDAASLQAVYGIRFEIDCIGSVTVQIGPNETGLALSTIFGGGSVDVGTAVNDYYYRFRYRNLDGSYSNWSPATRSGLHMVRNTAIITVPNPPVTYPTSFPNVYDKADVARFGGALTAFTYIGTTDSSLLWQLIDNNADEAVAINPQAQLDDFQPFPDIDVPHSGTCNVVGNQVKWVSGPLFNGAWAAGSEIIIGDIVYNLYTSPVAAAVLEILQNGETQNGVPFSITGPTILANPLSTVWGPTDDTGVFFGVGSNYQPGVVFWTNGNSPDNASDNNQLELTSPSAPLIGGCLNSGRSIVASVKRDNAPMWWALYPQLNSPTQYQPVELQIGHALWCRTGLATNGSLIWFISEDGIYVTALSQAQSITDADLRDIFPHDNQAGVVVTVGGGVTVQPPNMAFPMQLNYIDGLLFFDYQYGTVLNTNFATLVFDTRINGWVSYDINPVGVNTHYGEEGQGIYSALIGGVDGYLYQFSGTSDAAGATPGTALAIAGQINPPSFDGGDFRCDDKWGDLVLDYDATGAATGIVLKPQFNDYAVAPIAPTTLGPTVGRALSFPIDLAQSLYRNISPLITWAEKVLIKLYGYQPSYIPQPENIALRITDWTDAGYPGAKFVQGLILQADTANTPLPVNVQGDAGMVGATLSIQHNGQTEIAYSFTPFVAHLLRLAQVTPNALWKFYGVRWVFEPMPELATTWQTQQTTHDLSGFMHVKEMHIALMSTSIVTISIQADNVTLPPILIPSTGGAYKKIHLLLPPNPNKAMAYSYGFTSTVGFRLFKRDIEVKVKQWGSTGPYLTFLPFGGQSRADGAAI